MPNPKSTKLVILGPTAAFRLSAKEIRLLDIGFFFISKYLEILKFQTHDWDLSHRLDVLRDQFQELAADEKCRTHRLHADVLALAAMILAARRGFRVTRGTPYSASLPNKKEVSNLTKRLEWLRKRAKRSWLRLGSAECYVQWRERWQRFLKATAKLSRPHKLVAEPLHSYMKTLERVVEVTLAILTEDRQNFDPRDLRPIVRQALHHVRRDRTRIWIRDLLLPTKEGRAFLIKFVERRLNVLRWKRAASRPGPLGSLVVDDDDPLAIFRDVVLPPK